MVNATVQKELGLTDDDLKELDELDDLVTPKAEYAPPDVLAETPEPEQWLCPICEKEYDDESEFNFHIGKRHPDYVPPRDADPETELAPSLDDDDRLPEGALPPDLSGDSLDGLDTPSASTDAARQAALDKLHAENPEAFKTEEPAKRRRATKAEMEDRKAKAIAEAALADTATKQAAPLAGTTDDAEERKQAAFARLRAPIAIATDAPSAPEDYADESAWSGIPPMSEQGGVDYRPVVEGNAVDLPLQYSPTTGKPRDVKISRAFRNPPPDALVPYITVNFEIHGRMDDVANALTLIGGVLRDNEVQWRSETD